MGVEEVHAFLGKAIDPPAAKNVELAMNTLMSLGAVSEASGELLPLGRHMVHRLDVN